MSEITITAFEPAYFDAVITLATEVHGDNYMDHSNIDSFYQRGIRDGINASCVALQKGKLVGFRITWAAGQWQPDKWCSPQKWPFSQQQVCYFKCNTVDQSCRGQGIGSAMLRHSIELAKQQGHKAGLAHIWLASPGNSAYRYFSKCGGVTITEHPNKWQELSVNEGYVCPVCGPLCHCTAAEMLLTF